MLTFLAVLHVFGGVVWLVVAGDLLVRGAIALSRRFGVSALVIGLTVVAFGTSAPELVVSVRAAFAGVPELAIANVVGSNTANVLLVVGLPAVIHPMACDQPGVARDGLIMLGTSALFVVLCWTGSIGRPAALVLLTGLALFTVHAFRTSGIKDSWSAESEEIPRILGLPSTLWMIALFLLLGITGLPLGAELLVRGAVGVAEAAGIPNSVVGLTVVAIGTSLPELATTLVAALKRQSDVAVGNVLGSNVLNLLAIMGVTGLVSPEPIPVPDAFPTLDLPVMLSAAAVLAVVIARYRTVGRRIGIGFLGAYAVYVLFLFRQA